MTDQIFQSATNRSTRNKPIRLFDKQAYLETSFNRERRETIDNNFMSIESNTNTPLMKKSSKPHPVIKIRLDPGDNNDKPNESFKLNGNKFITQLQAKRSLPVKK